MSHPYSSIPELANLWSGTGLIRIPMEQDVPFPPRVRAIVDTAEFQRLAHISQLGLAARVYPGATHTRFEHALGVFHNALRYIWQLGKDPRFQERVSVHEAEVLIVAAILHDLGHWPFCHPIEDMALADLPSHEEFAKEFLSSNRELANVLQSVWNVQPEEVLDVLVARTDTPSLRLMRSILSGPIDIDKMDYLDRDSLHAGVPYGRNFDKNRLIHSLILNESGDGLAITAKARTAAELMVFARYVMFSEVYWHHAVRAATAMFTRAFYRLYEDLDCKEFFQQTEDEMIRRMRDRAAGSGVEPLIEGVFGPKRRLYKRVAEYSYYQSRDVYERLRGREFGFLVECAGELAASLANSTGEPVAPDEVLIDAPPPHREVEFRVDVFFPKEGVYRPLTDVSPVIDALARTQFDDYVKRVRVFIDPDRVPCLERIDDFDAELLAAIARVDGR